MYMYLLKMKLNHLLFLYILLISTSLSAQKAKVDSLEAVLKKHTSIDSTKVNILNDLAYAVYSNDFMKAREYASQSMKISEEIGWMKGKATSLWAMGLTFNQSDKKLALDYYRKALSLAEKIGDRPGTAKYLLGIGATIKNMGNIDKSSEYYIKALQIAREFNDTGTIMRALLNLSQNQSAKGNITEALQLLQELISLADRIKDYQMLGRACDQFGGIYYSQGNYPVALEYRLSALKMNELVDDKMSIVHSLLNIAGIQVSQKDYNTALKTVQKAFVITKNIGDSQSMSVCLTNMGNIYAEMNNPIALQYFQKALKMSRGMRTSQTINLHMNIGAIYTERGEFDKSLKHLEEGLALASKVGNKRGSGELWIKMGLLSFAQKQYNQSIGYAKKALDIANEINYLELQKDCYKLLSDLYAETGKSNDAYLNYVQYKVLSDSLFNEKSIREIAILENTYKYDKERQKNELEKASQKLKINNQKQVILFLLIVSFLIFILALTIYWSNKLKKKVLRLEIENINNELEANQKAMTAATLKLVQNSERDTYCVKMLENIKTKTQEEGQNDIRSLIADYKLQSCNSNWEEFEILFEKVNTSFYKNLNERFPTLTPNERKLCVFFKLNMTNKQISQITFQSEEALKKARLRLRKKLELDRDDNLVTFIQNL